VVTIWLELCTSYSSSCHHHRLWLFVIRQMLFLVPALTHVVNSGNKPQFAGWASVVIIKRPMWKNRPAPFPGQMSSKTTKPGSIYFCLSIIFFIVLLLIRATFYVSLVYIGMCSVFWLFWLSCQYLPSNRQERLLWGSLTMSRDCLHKAHDYLGLVFCLAPVVTTTSIILCFTKHWLTQVHVENGH